MTLKSVSVCADQFVEALAVATGRAVLVSWSPSPALEVAACCSVCCSVFFGVFQFVAVCVAQCVAVYCNVLLALCLCLVAVACT